MWMSNQVHHAIWHRETYSAEGVLECLSGMPFEVEFISFDDVRNGIPDQIKVIINVGDAYTAFSGAENWIDEKVLTNIRRFVDQGGGFIGVGEPTAYPSALPVPDILPQTFQIPCCFLLSLSFTFILYFIMNVPTQDVKHSSSNHSLVQLFF